MQRKMMKTRILKIMINSYGLGEFGEQKDFNNAYINTLMKLMNCMLVRNCLFID